MRIQKIILPVIAALLLFPGAASASSFIDNRYLEWEILDRQCAEEITGDDESYLYIKLSGEQAKIRKDLVCSPEKLPTEEKNILRDSGGSMIKEADTNLFQRKERTLFYKDIPLLDISRYIEENDRYYRENSAYEWEDIVSYAYECDIGAGSKILQILTSITTHIPAPYTPSYSDTFLISGSQAKRLDLGSDFRLTKTRGNSDGSFWLEGWLRNGKASTENSLFLVGGDLKVFSFNAGLQKNDIQVLGQGENSLIIRAQTCAVNPYFPPDQNKYKVKGDGIYAVRSDSSYTMRGENIENYTSIYLDQKGYIYALSSDGKKIKNLTTGKGYRLEEAVTPYDREVQKLEGLDFKYGTSQTRLDQDGSVWYVQDHQIIHERQGNKTVFRNGLPVLMSPVENVFIDQEGGKWFLGPAGIAYYADGMPEALNMNPFLSGGIRPGDTGNLYVDGWKRIWFFDREIMYAPFKQSAVTTPETGLIQDYEQVYHDHKYNESAGQGIFIYQKENPGGTYTARVFYISREGMIRRQDYNLDKKLLRYFVYDDKIHLVLPDGLIILDNNKGLTVRNVSLLQGLHFMHRDSGRIIFTGQYRIVMVSIPKPGRAVDNFVKASTTVTVKGKTLPAYQVQGKLTICVEDLQHCGYDMVWNPVQRTTSFTRQDRKAVDMAAPPLLKANNGTIYYSDVDVYIDGVWHQTYNTDGFSLILLEDLPLE